MSAQASLRDGGARASSRTVSEASSRPRPPRAGAWRRAGLACAALALLLPAVAAFAQNTVPPAPTVSLMATTERVRISASVSSNGGSAITKWEWRFKGGAFGNYSPWHTVSNAVGNSMVYSAVAQAHGNTYTYQVRAVNAVGNGTSTEESIVVAGLPHSPPAATFTVTAGNASVTLAATTSDGGASISRWEYRQKAGSANYGSWQKVSGSAGTKLSTTVTSLTNGTTYRYQVRAVNSFGAGPASTEKSATPAVPAATVPAKPLIGLSSGGNGSFHIFGSSQGNGGSSITRWQRNYVSQTYTRTWADWTTYSGGHDTPYGRRPVNRTGETFRVKIKACNARGCGPESDTKHILAGTNYLKPAQPRNFTATARSGGVTLSANLPSGDGGATAAKWQYSYKTSGNYNSWRDIPNSWTESLSGRTVTGLTNGTTYTFRVRAHGHRNEQGPASNEVTVTPVAAVPPKPTLSVAVGDGKVTLSASVANNGGSAVTKWQVARKLTPDANLGAWTDIPSSPGNSISGKEVSGLSNHVSYTFAVRAVNSVGNSAQSSSVAVTPFGADSSPSFGSKTIGQRHFPLNSSASVTLPTATGGNGALTYEVTPALPAGLTFNAVTRTISGAATTAQSVGYYTYAVEDLDGDRVLLSFTIYVSEDLTPSFGTSTIADEYYTSATIPNKVLPAATSGNAPVTYTLSPALPQGLSFNASTRTISGTPAASQSSTSYTYKVTDGDGDTATLRFTIAVLLGAPPVPTVSITAGSDSATLQASVSSNGGSEITQWSFRARTGGAIWGNSTTVPGATGNSMVHTVTSLDRGSVYRFEVLAFNSAGSSGPGYAAIMVAGVPYKPPDATFTVTGGNASATLAATTKDGGASISRWEYRQKAGSGNYGSWQRVSKSAGTTFSTTVTGLTGNTTYAYQVRAVNSFGAGPASAEKSATPAATVPPKPDIGLSGADGNDFHLFGISRGNGGSAITGWQLHQTKTDGTWNSGWIAWTGYNGTDSSPYDRIDLARAGTFAVKVRVRNAIGWSPESDTKHITTGTRNIPPATPENFTATGGNASATLSVNLPSGDGGGTASGWQYSYKTTGNYGSWTDIPNSRTETLSGAVVTGLTNGTTYTFKVRAVGHRGEVSPDSAEATVTPTVAVATAPPKPTLSVAAGDGKVTLTASVANNGGASVSKWQVARKLTPDDALGAWTDIPSSAGNSITAKEVSGLTNHVSYTFAVRAVNSVGNSAQSSSVVVTPFAAESSPSFGSETIADMELVQTRSVSVTLPAATGGNGVLTYQLSPALPSGVTFNPATRTISGSPSALQSQADYTYTVRDTDNDTATLTFKLSVVANSTPSFGSETIADQSHEWNAAITDVTLPAVTGGNTPITYTLSPALPKGLSFDASTRVLSGTPTEKVSTTEYTYTATDYDDEAVSLTFDITVADTTAPTVVAASSGYYSDAGHSTGLSDYAPLGTDIHIKLTFSEDVAHTAGSGDSAKPVISYKIASEDAVQFSIVADTASLASGQCQPDAAAPADVYECYYRPTTGDNGTFDFSVGTGTEDTSSLALAATYTHATKLTVDTVLPTVVAADSGYYSDDALSDSLSGTVKTGEDIYIEVAFSEDMDHATGDVPNGRPFSRLQDRQRERGGFRHRGGGHHSRQRRLPPRRDAAGGRVRMPLSAGGGGRRRVCLHGRFGQRRCGRQQHLRHLHPRHQAHHPKDRPGGDRGEQRLLRRCRLDDGADGSGQRGHGHLRESGIQPERQAQRGHRLERATGTELQHRRRHARALPHRGAHRDAGERSMPPGRGDTRGRIRMPLHAFGHGQRQLRFPRRHRHPEHRQRSVDRRLHPHGQDRHRQHRADALQRAGERQHADRNLQREHGRERRRQGGQQRLGRGSRRHRPRRQLLYLVGRDRDPDPRLRGQLHRHGDTGLQPTHRHRQQARGPCRQPAGDDGGRRRVEREQQHRRTHGDRGKQRLLQRRGLERFALGPGDGRHGHLRQGGVQRKRRPHPGQRVKRPSGNQVQDRQGGRAAVRHRREHGDAR